MDFAQSFTEHGVTWSEFRTFKQAVEEDPDLLVEASRHHDRSGDSQELGFESSHEVTDCACEHPLTFSRSPA